MIVLTRSDTERNMSRFYMLGVMPTLFGEWTLMTEWGRIGSPGTVRQRTYPDATSATAALDQRVAAKARRGYCPASPDRLIRSYVVAGVAVAEWSNGNKTCTPCRTIAPSPKEPLPSLVEPSFDW